MPDLRDTISDSIKAYSLRAAYLLAELDATESDIGSVLVQTQELLKQASQGFESDRVNMKAEGGVSRLNEAMPGIAIQCLNIKLKANEMLLKILMADEQPDSSITLVVSTANLEDVLNAADARV